MQHTTFKCLVIGETDFSDADRYITVLTEPGGKLDILCRGVRRRGSRVAGAVRLFCYAEVTVYESRGRYTLNDAALIKSFWNITQDIDAYALSCYFAELAGLVMETDDLCPNVTALMLHALHALCTGKRAQPLIKAAFELRLFAETGFAPQLHICGACTKPLQGAYFSIQEGTAVCPDCAKRLGGKWGMLGGGTLEAMRHILGSEVRKVFSFALGEQSIKQLGEIAEKYALFHADRGFDSLKFYHGLQNPMEHMNTGVNHE